NVTGFSVAVFPPGEVAHEHSHADMAEVFFIQSGTGTISVDDQVVPLQPGQCVTVEPHERHELRNTGSKDMVVLYFGILV
ncbi:MAG TPA: cupin domain-containing protein, partial [Gammaproteobacteria bacterium]|nr:cupin domain-containing protein [Gammaproteobacteria bacterium]